MEVLNLSSVSPADTKISIEPVAPSERKNVALAWLLSVFCPGTGQLYCGYTGRGATTLAVFWAAMAVLVLGETSSPIWGAALRTAIALWCFATLDAFFTAKEVNAGAAPLLEGANPRVAAILNLTTRGWGYFYLGRREGIIVFVLLLVLYGVTAAAQGSVHKVLQGATELIMIALCIHAYQLARRRLKDVLPAELGAGEGMSIGAPLALAGFAAVNYVLLCILGLMLPTYKPVDQSRAGIVASETETTYTNLKYGVAIRFPVGWTLSYPTPNEFVMGTRPGGGCVVQFMAAAEMPFVSPHSDIRDLKRILAPKGYIVDRERDSRLGRIRASEVSFRHPLGDDRELDQSYVFAKKRLSSYILIMTSVPDLKSKCEALSEQIRDSLRLP